MQRLTRFAIAATAAALIAASFLPLIETNAWWVRMLDFPRLQLLIALPIVGFLLLMFGRGTRRATQLLVVGIVAATVYHGVKLRPYLPWGDAMAATCAEEEQFSVMVANVQLGNRRAKELLDIVRGHEPDLFLAMETDEWWDEALAPLSSDMPHAIQKITGSYFGIHLFSRLPLTESDVIFPVEQDAPAIVAEVALPGDETVRFIGVHPRPPHPSQPSTGRDAQLMRAALVARESGDAVVVAGDLNAVPWERTVERMKRIGRLVDPRERFGYIPTYDAQSWWMAWPLDQVLHGEALTVSEVERLPAFGSDHYPYLATLCLGASDRAAPDLAPGDIEEAEATIKAALEGGSEKIGN